MRIVTAMALATLMLGVGAGDIRAMPVAALDSIAAAAAQSSVTEIVFVCRRWHDGGAWIRRCWWISEGPFWPPTWRGSGWRGPGWYGRGWRKRYFWHG